MKNQWIWATLITIYNHQYFQSLKKYVYWNTLLQNLGSLYKWIINKLLRGNHESRLLA